MYNLQTDPAVQNYKHLAIEPVHCSDCAELALQPIYWCGTSARCVDCHMKRMTDDKGDIRQLFGSILKDL